MAAAPLAGGLALALIPVAAVFDFASGAQLAAQFTVAVYRPGRVTGRGRRA